jgi:hypothetical protein
MKSEYPGSPMPPHHQDEIVAIPSRFIDEKISDEHDTEATSDSALAPTGLDNPFWN